jgi:hypothetical protein
MKVSSVLAPAISSLSTSAMCCVLDAFIAGQEGDGLSYGLRTEWMIKF